MKVVMSSQALVTHPAEVQTTNQPDKHLYKNDQTQPAMQLTKVHHQRAVGGVPDWHVDVVIVVVGVVGCSSSAFERHVLVAQWKACGWGTSGPGPRSSTAAVLNVAVTAVRDGTAAL